MDPTIVVNTLCGIINFGKCAYDLYRRLQVECQSSEWIIRYREYREEGSYEAAVRCLDKAIEMNRLNEEKCSELYILKGLTFCEKSSDIILQNINKIIGSHGDKDFLFTEEGKRIILSIILEDSITQRSFIYALNAFDCAIKLNPTLIQAWINKSYILFLLDRCEEAIESIDTTFQIDPLDDEPYAKLLTLKGFISIFLNRYEDSIKCFLEIVGMDKKDTRSYKTACIMLKALITEIQEGNIQIDN